MGRVYLAEHGLLNDLQAVKILDPEFTRNEQIVTRFLNEGRAAVKLRHRNLVAVHNIGRLPDGPYFMVMEFLEGGTLGGHMDSLGGPMAVHQCLRILVQVMNCVQWIHDHGVVHRDLKLENVFLVARFGDPHFPIVLDLGVAQLADHIARGPGTKAGTVIGTPVYMAPEQLKGERVTPAADLFALAVMAYEMTTGGWFPFQRDGETRSNYFELPEAELFDRQRSGPIDPRRRYPAMHEAWAKAIMAGLSFDPRKRPDSVRAYALLLATAVPPDGTHDDGLQIIKQCAKELLRSNEASETIRSQKPMIEHAPATGSKKLRYQLGPKLGVGGMAEVFDGVLIGVEGFSRRVAIKRVLAGLSEVPAFVTMFISEARIASQLSHTNVVSTIDFDRDADGRLYLVMEHVHGRDLATLLESGPIAPSLVIFIASEMLRGLGYAHAPEPARDVEPGQTPKPGRDGIVHRDMSPQNLLLGYEGDVKVSDFGLAKARDASGNARSESVRGKPSYMSPEQVNGEALDARSDLFAVGTMIWEMLAHRPLFAGTQREILANVLFKTVPPPSSVRSRVPTDLEAITMRLLARDPSDRYPNAEAVIADLLRCADAPRDGRGELVRVLAERFPDNALRTRASGAGSAGALPRLHAAQMAVPTPLSTLAGAASESVPRVRSKLRRGLMAGVASAVIVAGVVGVLAFVRRDSAKQTMRQEPNAATTSDENARARVASLAILDAGPSPHDARVREPVIDASTRAAPEDAASVEPMYIDAGVPVATKAAIRRQPVAPVAPVAPVKRPLGELAVAVKPWCRVYLNGKPAGQCPYRENLPSGTYRLRITNEDLGKDETITVIVSPDAPKLIQRTWNR